MNSKGKAAPSVVRQPYGNGVYALYSEVNGVHVEGVYAGDEEVYARGYTDGRIIVAEIVTASGRRIAYGERVVK